MHLSSLNHVVKRWGRFHTYKSFYLDDQPKRANPKSFIIIVRVVTVIIELTHSQTILEITVEIDPKQVALDFKNLSQYSSRSK